MTTGNRHIYLLEEFSFLPGSILDIAQLFIRSMKFVGLEFTEPSDEDGSLAAHGAPRVSPRTATPPPATRPPETMAEHRRLTCRPIDALNVAEPSFSLVNRV